MRYSALVWGLMLAGNLAIAAEDSGSESLESLDADFLEFLGLWETETGEWMPPEEFAEMQLGEASDVEAGEENAQEVANEE